MKTIAIKLSGLVLIFIMVFATLSCDKDDEEGIKSDLQTANDYIKAELTYLEAFNIVYAGAFNPNVMQNGVDTVDGVIITYASNLLTVDFGDTLIQSSGKERKGKIKANFSTNNLFDPTFSADFIFENYHIVYNDSMYQINSDTFTVENVTTVDPEYRIHVTGGSLNYLGTTSVITFKTTHNLVIIQGSTTPANILDDIFTISGSSEGATPKGAFTSDFEVPLKVQFDCPHRFVSGRIKLNSSAYGGEIIIDFNPGAVPAAPCDNTLRVYFTDSNGSIDFQYLF